MNTTQLVARLSSFNDNSSVKVYTDVGGDLDAMPVVLVKTTHDGHPFIDVDRTGKSKPLTVLELTGLLSKFDFNTFPVSPAIVTGIVDGLRVTDIDLIAVTEAAEMLAEEDNNPSTAILYLMGVGTAK
jgi:hypothetical protein